MSQQHWADGISNRQSQDEYLAYLDQEMFRISSKVQKLVLYYKNEIPVTLLISNDQELLHQIQDDTKNRYPGNDDIKVCIEDIE